MHNSFNLQESKSQNTEYQYHINNSIKERLIEIAVKINNENLNNCKKTLKNNALILFFISLFPLFVNGQQRPDFSILTDKAFQKLYENPEDCISYSQSLLISDKKPEHKIILKNILSQAYAMQGNYVQSVNIYNQKEEDSGKDSRLLYFVQLFTDYSLADQYQNLGLYHQSKKIIANILQNNELLKSNDTKVRMTLAKLYQLQSINSGITRNYKEAVENLNKSDQYLDSQNKENKILTWENKIFRASYLIRQHQFEAAKKLLEEVIDNAEKNDENPFITAFAYEHLSRYYFQKKEYSTAIKKLESGLLKIDQLPYNNLKTIIYELLARNYLALNDNEKYHYYNNLYSGLKTKLDSNKKEGIQYIVKLADTYQNKNIDYQEYNKFKQLITVVIIFSCLILGITIYFFYETGRSKDLKKQLM